MISLKKPVFLSNFSKRQLISLFSFFIVLVCLPLTIFLVKQQQSYQGRAVGPEARPNNVKITNLHGGGFSVSWTSSDPNNDNQFIETTGWIEFGSTNTNLNQKIDDDRGGENFSSTTHHVSVFNLQAETTYYFKIKSGPDLYGLNVAGDGWVKGGTAKERATPKTLELTGNPQPIYGFIKNQSGDKVAGALVYVQLKKDNSDTNSALMSTVTSTNEGWVMDAKNARNQDLGQFFDFDDNDRVLIEVQAAEKGIAATDFAVSACSPAPEIVLIPTIVSTPTPTAGPTGSLTPTEAPTSEPTSQPTTQPTAQPTAQPTTPPTTAPTSQPTTPPASNISKGDFNGDNIVNALDWSIMKSHYGKSATSEQGDLNGDGLVNSLDWSIMKGNYGKSF
jgi:hypothetical protein